jgi:hypothetical protein
MSKYIRKTEDVYNIYLHTHAGWEIVNCEPTWKKAKESLKEYRENAPGLYKYKKCREKILK